MKQWLRIQSLLQNVLIKENDYHDHYHTKLWIVNSKHLQLPDIISTMKFLYETMIANPM